MAGLSASEKKFLLSLARRSIEHYFKTRQILEPERGDVPSPSLLQSGACFVTLHLKGELRGCIGSLEAHRPLVYDVINNALASAFEDTRFYPLTSKELVQVKISISYLTPAKPLPVKNAEDLLKKLVAKKHGLILEKGWARATFLPAVWEELATKEEFLGHLCMKAGLPANAWHEAEKMKFQTYEADEFSE
jgi:AmmeMemoRadiSam system protein A